MSGMVLGWERRQQEADLHFVTFSGYHRLGYLSSPGKRDLLEEALGRMCYCYVFDVVGCVVMPHISLVFREMWDSTEFSA